MLGAPFSCSFHDRFRFWKIEKHLRRRMLGGIGEPLERIRTTWWICRIGKPEFHGMIRPNLTQWIPRICYIEIHESDTLTSPNLVHLKSRIYHIGWFIGNIFICAFATESVFYIDMFATESVAMWQKFATKSAWPEKMIMVQCTPIQGEIMYIKRKIDVFLENWKARTTRKPLILRGARQIGKTATINALFFQILALPFFSFLV